MRINQIVDKLTYIYRKYVKRKYIVGILGNTGTRDYAFMDKELDAIYLCNKHKPSDIKWFTKWFDIHPWGSHDKYKHVDRKDLMLWYNYPLDKALDIVGYDFTGKTYINNSVSYMILYAIMQGATEIRLYGVELITNEERKEQRANTRELLWLAKGMGIKVWAIEPTLMEGWELYGYSC